MKSHHLVKGTCELLAHGPPLFDLIEPKRGRASELRRIEILVRDGIPPVVEQFEQASASHIPGIVNVHCRPEVEA